MVKSNKFISAICFLIASIFIAGSCSASHPVYILEESSTNHTSTHILLYSDAGYANEGQNRTAAAMARRHTEYPFDFAISAGDNIQLKPEIFGSRSMLDQAGDGGMSEAFERPFSPLIRAGIRFYAALGNHDHQGFRYYIERNYSDRINARAQNIGGFVLPDSDYVIRCNGIKIIFLDVATAFSNLNWSNDRESFVRKELGKYEDRWNILVFHYPLWSSGEHGRDEALRDLRKVILPVLDEFPVDLVVSGHDHHAELFRYQGKTLTRIAIVGNTAKPHDLPFEPEVPSIFRSNTRGFTELDIHDNRAEISFRSIAGTILHKEIISK